MKKTVLVTGGAGYVGSGVIAHLLENNFHVVCADKLLFGGESLVPYFKNPNFNFSLCDLTDKEATTSLFRKFSFYGIVHLAAIVGDPACKREPEVARATNLDASIHLMNCAKEFGVERFIFASTCSNYGKMGDSEGWVDEKSPLSPVSLYAETKVSFEKELLEKEQVDNFFPTALRFSTVYGLSQRMRFDLTVNEFTKELTLGRCLPGNDSVEDLPV
ncbi:MAG: SDR family oxidoreductase [Pseudomonadota bacterium]